MSGSPYPLFEKVDYPNASWPYFKNKKIKLLLLSELYIPAILRGLDVIGIAKTDGDNNNTNGTLNDAGDSGGTSEDKTNSTGSGLHKAVDPSAKLSVNVLALPGMQEAILKKAGVVKEDGLESGMGGTNPNHFVEEIEINGYPREARWKVTRKETTSRLQDEFQTAVTLKSEYFGSGRVPNTAEGERKLYLHLEATTSRILKNCVLEICRLWNEETLWVGTRGLGDSHRYNVL